MIWDDNFFRNYERLKLVERQVGPMKHMVVWSESHNIIAWNPPTFGLKHCRLYPLAEFVQVIEVPKEVRPGDDGHVETR